MSTFRQNGRIRFWCSLLSLLAALLNLAESQKSVHDLKLIEGAKEKGAVCIDGTAPGYYFSPGFGVGIKHWLVYIEGGGWCKSNRDCANRAKTYLGSTSLISTRTVLPNTGILSDDPDVNPDFYNWNVAWIRYCDGASFLGNRDEPVVISEDLTIYYRGQKIWDALMEDLMASGMAAAEKVLLTGCSAGGLTTILHCDSFKALFPGDTLVKCVADAGFFLDVPDVGGGSASLDLFRGVALTHNVMDNLDKACTASRDRSLAWECIFAQNALPHVQTPLYILQSDLDYWQITNLIAPKAADPAGIWQQCTEDLGSCTSGQLDVLQAFRDSMVQALGDASPPTRGEFIISCYAHCIATDSHRWNGHESFLIKGKTMAQSVGDWYYGKDLEDLILVDGPYPSNPTCAGKTNTEETNFAEHLNFHMQD